MAELIGIIGALGHGAGKPLTLGTDLETRKAQKCSEYAVTMRIQKTIGNHVKTWQNQLGENPMRFYLISEALPYASWLHI